MPNIEEFNAGSGELVPSDRGTQAAAMAGRRIGTFYHQMGEDLGGGIAQMGQQLERHQTQQEMLHLYSSGVDLENTLQDSWKAYANDPANKGKPDLARTFMSETAGPLIENWQGHATTDGGQRFAAEYGARVRQNLFEHTAAEQGVIDSVTAHTNVTNAIDGLSTSIMNDPSGNHDAQIGTMKDVVTAFTSNIQDPAQRETATAELTAQAEKQGATTHYLSLIQSGQAGIDQARKDLAADKYGDYLGGETMEALGRRADEQERTNASRALAADAQARKQQEDAGHQEYFSILASMTDKNTGAPLPPTPEIMDRIGKFGQNYSRVLPAEAAGLLASGRTSLDAYINHTYVQSDSRTFADLNSRVGVSLTHAEVDQAHARGLLSEKDWRDLHEEVERVANDPEMKALTQAKAELFTAAKPTFGGVDLTGGFQKADDALRFYYFQEAVNNNIQAALKQGKTPADIRAQLFDHASPTFQFGAAQRNYYTHMSKDGLSQAAQAAMQADHAARAAAAAQLGTRMTTGVNSEGSPTATVPVAGAVVTAHMAQDAAAAGAQPRKAGESPTAYLARTGGH